ncbi:MAG: M14 family metallocarboxypeptidase [Porticoccaceae bacterium]|nr:M14 family metallocarboxypeptidase [Porticoccaceae bacterium]MDG1474272.1 M14 family metallocarboxypeptidase [Porticoccaceae bacterium]
MTITRKSIIGIPGIPWGPHERKIWLSQQTIKRSYQDQVIARIEKIEQQLSSILTIEQYGALSSDPDRYSLWAFKSKHWQELRPSILITGGVHGYETSGVQGALRFVESTLTAYKDLYNFVVIPCISPWSYETINRWTSQAIDPNRSFTGGTAVEECRHLMTYVKELNIEFHCHMDLHETTDTDNLEFRPALEARDAIAQDLWEIPDGFYGVGNTEKPQPAFQKAIIDAVAKVTHIAPCDENNCLIGTKIEQHGVINYPIKALGLCAAISDAPYVSTTEVYPDSPHVNDENCVLAQVAAICGALDYLQGTPTP